MKVAGTTTMDAPIDKVWEAFLTPEVLIKTIPGCERLEERVENEYLATVTVGVGAIKGSYQGKVKLTDLNEHESLTLHAQAAAATGTIDVDVAVTFTNLEGRTQIDYDADATVGGMIGGVGQRMLTSVSKRMADQFFANVNKVLTGQTALEEPTDSAEIPGEQTAGSEPGPAPKVRTLGAAPASSASREESFKGFIAGALTALLGVVVGALVARRR